MTATPTTSDGSPQILTAAGPSLPVIVTLDSQQATMPVGVFTALSPDSNLKARFEVCCDRPDVNGYLPSNATWVPYTPRGFTNTSGWIEGVAGLGIANAGVGAGQSQVSKLDVTITAIRVNVISYIAGSLTFGVSQNTIPRLRGGF